MRNKGKYSVRCIYIVIARSFESLRNDEAISRLLHCVRNDVVH